MTLLVGIDLAWSGVKPTGICVLDAAGARLGARCLATVTWPPEAVFEWLESLGDDVLAAIDAPLVIGDQRRAEALMASAFPGTGLRAYSARWDFLARHGITAGPELGALLAAAGWSLEPTEVCVRGRRAVEVFPHAVIVSLLQSPRLLKYKKGAMGSRRAALATFQVLLGGYAGKCLPVASECPVAARIANDVMSLRGAALKGHEDELDAIACAFAAHHFLTGGPEPMRVFGDATEGYIAVPA